MNLTSESCCLQIKLSRVIVLVLMDPCRSPYILPSNIALSMFFSIPALAANQG